jgi:hypothetical protein
MHSRLCVSREPEHMQILLITFGMKGSSYICSQITGGVDNAIPLRVDISCTSGRSFDLPSEATLKEYLQFPYECFLSVLQFKGYCCKLCPSKIPEGLRSDESAGKISLLIILSPKASDKECIDILAV